MSRKYFLFVIFLFTVKSTFSQQNSTLFFMQSTPQANFVNPAVRSDCKWIIGLPVLSSVHSELGNQAFTVHQVLKKQPDNSYIFDGNEVMKSLGRTNYLDAEVHANLFYLGFWVKKNFFTISINEKVDLFATYPRDLFALAWNGNTQFEGKTADLSHTGAFLNYRHELGFGLSREYGEDVVWGVRAKLLFGVANSSVPKSFLQVYTDPTFFNLSMKSDWRINSLLPLRVVDSAGQVRSVRYNNRIEDMIFNFKNLGIAFDFGFIKYKDENITIAGSILDLGLIRWTGNTANFSQQGDHTYRGMLADSLSNNNFIAHFGDVLKNDFGLTTEKRSYVSFLNPVYYLGGTYRLRGDLNAGAVISGRINRFRLTSSVTLSLNKAFQKWASASISWSYLYQSLGNIGAGIRLGHSPVQFYAVSDNVLGFIRPYDVKNVNLRVGLQFTPGCVPKKFGDGCGCNWTGRKDRKISRHRKH